MRATTLLATALLTILAAFTTTARAADDLPGLALAKQIVDEVRGDEHKSKMRIVWPETAEATPPEGAEVVLITGYIDYTLTRFAWRDGKVDARSVSTSRSWFYNPNGESYSAREFDVDAVEFAKSWAAARFIVGAREERVEPAPEDEDESQSGGWSLSHESRRYLRVLVARAAAPLLCSDPSGHERNWEAVRDEAVCRAFVRLIPAKDASRTATPASWASILVEEIRRATADPHLERGGEHELLVEVCLRVVGEFGDGQALKAVEAWDAKLATVQGDQFVLTMLHGETATAWIKLRLALHWDSAAALVFIRGHKPKSDLDRWIRRRFRANDLVAYFDLVKDDTANGTPISDYDLVDTLQALRERPAPSTLDALRRLLDRSDVDVRVGAAGAVLAIDAGDVGAIRVLHEVIDDPHIPIRSGLPDVRWIRIDALNEAVLRGALGPKELRELLSEPRPEHGLFVRALLDATNRTSEPATRDEALAAWRRVLDGPAQLGAELAVSALLDLHDAPSRGRMSQVLEVLGRFHVGRGARISEREVVRLQKRLADEMPEPSTPK